VTGAALVLLIAVQALAGGRWLARARWVRRAPGLAILTWQMICAATLLAVVLLGATSVLRWDDDYMLMCHAWRVCFDALQGAHGGTALVVAWAGATLLAGVVVRLLVSGWRVAGAERRQRRRLRLMIRVAGRRMPVLDATIVPLSHPAAYVVPGIRTDVVITSGAVDRLSTEELHAVMAHEHAHATGRHYWLLRPVRLLYRAFPRVPLFALAVVQVQRLVELRADDVAVRVSPRLTLARALVAMAQGRATPTGAPTTVLAADGGDAMERLDRLLHPPAPLPPGVTRAAAAAAAGLPLLPVLITLLGHYSRLG